MTDLLSVSKPCSCCWMNYGMLFVCMYISSHLVTVATGPRLSDALISSPIIVEDGAVPGAGFEFGIDPNEDPELALVSNSDTGLKCTIAINCSDV